MIELKAAPVNTYRFALSAARLDCKRVKDATSAPGDMPESASYYLSPDGLSGFGVSTEGELIGLFSLVRGRGKELVTRAIEHGATRLDCFDGFLPGFYAALGFRETRRAGNWTPGGPDVVYMALHRVSPAVA